MSEPETNQIEVVRLNEVLITKPKPEAFLGSIRQLDHVNPTNKMYVRVGFRYAGPLDRMFAFGALDGAGGSGHRWIIYEVGESVSVRYLTWILNTVQIFYEIRSEEPTRDEMKRRHKELREKGDRDSNPYITFTDEKIKNLRIPIITNRSATEQDLITQRFEYRIRNQSARDEIFYPNVAEENRKKDALKKGLGLS